MWLKFGYTNNIQMQDSVLFEHTVRVYMKKIWNPNEPGLKPDVVSP